MKNLVEFPANSTVFLDVYINLPITSYKAEENNLMITYKS